MNTEETLATVAVLALALGLLLWLAWHCGTIAATRRARRTEDERAAEFARRPVQPRRFAQRTESAREPGDHGRNAKARMVAPRHTPKKP